MKTRDLIHVAGAIIAVALFAGCDKSGKDVFTEELVLQGSMFVGHPLGVRVTHTIPIEQAYDPRAVGVSGASVNITADGHSFTLRELPADTGGAGYYALPADSHVVTPGVSYAIRVEALGHVLTAQTVAAGPVHLVGQRPDSALFGAGSLTYQWTPDSLSAGYDAIFEMTDADWNATYHILASRNGDNGGPNERIVRVSRFVNSATIPWDDFDRWGDYRMRLLSCDQAAWNYFWTYRPGEINTQPISNVQGGIGVFSAGGADTAYFYLKDNPAIRGRGL